MKKNFNIIFNNVKDEVVKHAPEILTGIGIAGMITTTVLAVKATPKALILIEDEKREQNRKNLEEASKRNYSICTHVDTLKPLEVIKVVWKPYVPAAITGITSVACLIGASSVNARRNAALATAYQLSQAALSDYKEKVIETIGEKKDQVIKDKIAKEKIDEHPVSKSGDVIITEKGNTLCYDAISGRYFRSDVDQINKVVNELNRQMLSEMYISLNQFYSALGLSTTTLGDELGWNVDDGMIDISISAQIAEDNTPCIVIDYLIAPKYDFSKLL